MIEATQPGKICAGYEPIVGYTLEKLIGQGGFGEVWRADAPGGLKKAVKFVFGSHDEQRAARELKSLERIKGISHPFLLTLERFGIVGDQLVIVTELADGSLEDVFREHRDRGSCGISRDKLLKHLHDAADALDYLHANYQLQHLDIKPGNLLMVGGHVKVADFGLLKDLRDNDCSIVGGLTPVYAPPEVFDGRPSLHSDQYSIAVMYQELLTGTRPFSGRTIAQLATQHVHNAPDLEPLPPSDRPAVARALEKNPNRRFATCCEFVEALMKRRPGSGTSVKNSRYFDLTPEDTVEGFPDGLTNHHQSAADLPSLGDANIQRAAGNATKVLLLALGGTGYGVLQEIRQRISNLHSACPIRLHSMLIDTDGETVRAARIANTWDAMDAFEIVHIPLRTAHEYRQSLASNRLRTISRRWIYNVPRSLSTEGMRPLGRLALVDHGVAVTAALTEVVKGITETSDESNPKIFVVGSLCGGTGSGIYLDTVHLLRHLLDTSEMEQAQILSLLSIKGLTRQTSVTLDHHAAHAALMEMGYFMRPGNGYPGDEGAQWPSVPAARSPLKHAYVVASNSDEHDAPTPVQVISDYIWTDCTGAGDLLSKARKLELEESTTNIAQPQLRSVGIVTVGAPRRPEEEVLTPATVRQLLLRWLGNPSNAKAQADSLAKRLSRRSGFDVGLILQTISSAFAKSPQSRLQQLQLRLQDTVCKVDDSLYDKTLAQHVVSDWMSEVHPSIDEQQLVEKMMQRVIREVVTRVASYGSDITTMIEGLSLFLVSVCDASKTLAEHNRILFQADQQTLTKSLAAKREPETESALQLLSHTIERISLEQIDRFTHRLSNLINHLGDIATTLAVAISGLTNGHDATANPWSEMPAEIASKFEHTVVELHRATVNSVLLRSLTSNVAVIDAVQMQRHLTESASPMVGSALAIPLAASIGSSQWSSAKNSTQVGNRTAVTPVAAIGNTSALIDKDRSALDCSEENQDRNQNEDPEPADQQAITSMAKALELVRPALLDCGGVQRLILTVGTHSEQVRLEAELRQFHAGELTILLVPGTTAKLIHEAQQINLEDVLNRIASLNGGSDQVSARLLTRTDVDWGKGSRR